MTSHSPRAVATIVLSVAAILTSCTAPATDAPTAGTNPETAETGEPAAHNAVDVAFARNMIPHHQQAVVLAAMVPARTANATLRVMATHIGADQQAEIRTLEGLLVDWGERMDAAHMSPAHSHGMTMTGMVDQPTLDRLQTLDDDAFDRLWITSMIGHHRGAITMAQDEKAHGTSVDAIHVAELIITAQQREIAMMTHLISAPQ